MAINWLKRAIYEELKDNIILRLTVGDKIYPNTVPQKTSGFTGGDIPYIVFSRISSSHEHNLTGAAGLVETRIQIDSYSDSASEVDQLSNSVRNVFDGAIGGTMGTTDHVEIRDIKLVSDNDTFIKSTDASDNGIYRTSQDFVFWSTETVPTF